MMSGIYIPMEIPKSCNECPACYDMMECSVAEPLISFYGPKEEEFDFCTERHPRCPLIPVPDHGDLIARDDLVAAYDAEHAGHPGRARELMMEAPAVIPARKEDE